MNAQGVLLSNVHIASPDGTVSISIPYLTKALDTNGNPLSRIEVQQIESQPTPPKGYHILAAFKFQPDGAKFDPGIQITITFDPSQVAPGETVAIAYLNDATGSWTFIEGTVNPDGTATFTVSHFTTFAVLEQLAATPTPTPTPTPAPTPVADDGGIGTGAIVGIVAGILVLLAAVIWLLMRRRKTA
jgi:hypothetical protein